MADRTVGVAVRRRSVPRIAVLLVGLLLAITACSVPSQSKPIVDPNLVTGVNQSGRGGQPPTADPDRNFYRPTDEAVFVTTGYMNAVVSQVGYSAQKKSALAFMAQTSAWNAPPNQNKLAALPVNVVREIGSPRTVRHPDGTSTVSLDVDTVGSYDPVTGSLTGLSAGASSTTLSFTVEPTGTGSFRLTKAPAGFYMFSMALWDTQNYTPQSLYFWTVDGQLVPDLRYLPTWQSPRQQVTAIVTWILSGPAGWIGSSSWRPAVPPGVSLQDIVTIDKVTNAFVVNLTTTTLSPDQQNAFLVQIRWSIGSIDVDPTSAPGTPQGVELQIANRTLAATGANFLSLNLAAPREETPVAYAVVGGKLQAVGYAQSGAPNTPTITLYGKDSSAIQPKAFSAPENKDVKLGAVHLSQSQADVAIVREVGGKPELWVNRAPLGEAGKFVQVSFGSSVASFSRPIWLTQQPDALAVVADGKLYIVTAKNRVIPVESGVSNITAFDIGQDGYRIAYVAGGQVTVAVLTAPGPQPPSTAAPTPALSTGMPINLRPDLDSVGSVAWSGISELVATGTYGSGGKGYVIETNLDGVVANDGNPRLSETGYAIPAQPQIASYPLAPGNDSFSPVMIEEAGGAYSGRATLSPMWAAKATPADNPFFGN